MNIAIIPARGGSRRIPGKNIRLFHGKPILAYSIETAKGSGCFDKVVVSSEHQATLAVAKAYGAKLHNRPRALADNDVGTQAVMRSAIAWWLSCSQLPDKPEFVCCIYATAPLMLAADLRVGLEMLHHGTMSYVYSVEEAPGGGAVKDAGQWYWGRTEAFLESVPLEGNSAFVRIPPERVCDINTEDDWQRAERLYTEWYNPRTGEASLT